MLFRMVWGNISKIFQKHFKPTNLIQQIKNLLIYQRKYDRLYHVKVITYSHARVAQGWSTTLPRWGPRVRIPSRAFFYFQRKPLFSKVSAVFYLLPCAAVKSKTAPKIIPNPRKSGITKGVPSQKNEMITADKGSTLARMLPFKGPIMDTP